MIMEVSTDLRVTCPLYATPNPPPASSFFILALVTGQT